MRAQLADTPEDSEYTSIKQRIEQIKDNSPHSLLAPFTGDEKNEVTSGVPYHLQGYIELVEWTGRAIRNDKRGSIDSTLPPILERIGLAPSDWITFATDVESQCGNWVGSPKQFSHASESIGQSWICYSMGSQRFY